MADRELPGQEHDEWGTGWEGHRIRQLTQALEATPAQRLAWLDEVIALAYQAGALPRARAGFGG